MYQIWREFYMEKILLIEDDADIREMLIDYLSGDGYEITAYADGVSVWAFTDITDYSLALVDLMLPQINGFELIKKIREISTIPIIIITAKNSDHDKSRGLSLGADDYVTKPFSIVELSARIKANIRRVAMYDVQTPTENIIQLKDLQIDLSAHIVKRGTDFIDLTRTEFDILVYLSKNRNRALSKESIYQKIWKEPYYGNENVLNTHMNRLRNKLKNGDGEYIKTLWGIGYKIMED
jgi:DNA-binding response OmpR family regulator